MVAGTEAGPVPCNAISQIEMTTTAKKPFKRKNGRNA
jgi:hypothetical protein